jgi:hypothetical protein
MHPPARNSSRLGQRLQVALGAAAALAAISLSPGSAQAFVVTVNSVALLAVLLLQMAAALERGSRRYQARRLLVRRTSRLVMVGFLLLLPLQGLAA